MSVAVLEEMFAVDHARSLRAITKYTGYARVQGESRATRLTPRWVPALAFVGVMTLGLAFGPRIGWYGTVLGG